MSSISNEKILEILNKIENDCDIRALKLAEYCCWPLIRIVSSFELISYRYNNLVRNEHKLGKQFLFTKFKNNPNINKKVALFSSSQNYKVVVEGITYDRVLFGEEKKSSESSLDTIEIIYGIRNNLFSTGNVLYLGSLSRIFAKLRAFVRCLIPTPKFLKILWIIRRIETDTNCNDRFISIKKFRIFIKIFFVEYYSRYLERLLVDMNLTKICTSNYYSLDSMALILAGHRLGIPTINIQHGVQSKNSSGLYTMVKYTPKRL